MSDIKDWLGLKKGRTKLKGLSDKRGYFLAFIVGLILSLYIGYKISPMGGALIGALSVVLLFWRDKE